MILHLVRPRGLRSGIILVAAAAQLNRVPVEMREECLLASRKSTTENFRESGHGSEVSRPVLD